MKAFERCGGTTYILAYFQCYTYPHMANIKNPFKKEEIKKEVKKEVKVEVKEQKTFDPELPEGKQREYR